MNILCQLSKRQGIVYVIWRGLDYGMRCSKIRDVLEVKKRKLVLKRAF